MWMTFSGLMDHDTWMKYLNFEHDLDSEFRLNFVMLIRWLGGRLKLYMTTPESKNHCLNEVCSYVYSSVKSSERVVT